MISSNASIVFLFRSVIYLILYYTIFDDLFWLGTYLEVLDNLKTSVYLVDFAIEVAQEIQELAGLRYLVLLPDNDKLQNVYKNMGFVNLPKQDWLYIKL